MFLSFVCWSQNVYINFIHISWRSLLCIIAYFLQFVGDFWYMMPPKRWKYCRSLLPAVLSYLPDNITDVILMHLPCKDAVKANTVSKNNGGITGVDLKSWSFESLWKTKKDLLNPTIKFTKIIYQLLTVHEGPITKFTLNVAYLESCPEIDNFRCFLSRNDIQDLVLHLPLGKMYKLRTFHMFTVEASQSS